MIAVRVFAAIISVSRSYSSRSSVQTAYKKRPPKTASTSPRKIKWTEEQTNVISAISSGQSVFFTGSAGTGKTALMKHAIKLLQKSLGMSKVFITASTGIAACALKGQTLHSFAGFGNLVNERDRNALLERVSSDRRATGRWNRALALVIDEISMVDGETFDHLEFIARELRGSEKSWGGIQLIVCGDFFQLPPVSKNSSSSEKEFAFQADCWDSSFDVQVEFTKVFRQSEERLIELLQGIRKGDIDPEELEFLENSCSNTGEPDPSVVRLYPRNVDVSIVNEKRMAELGKEGYTFVAADSGSGRAGRQFGLAPDKIFLCEGARVMLVKNMNTWRGLVNGATGTVVGFEEDEEGVSSDVCLGGRVLPVVKFDSGRTVVMKPQIWRLMEADAMIGQRKQIPLVLAWALSIHKCQGLTLDQVHADLSKAFGYGMVYVALSRVRSLSGLHVLGLDHSKIKAHPEVVRFYERITKLKQEETDGRSTGQGWRWFFTEKGLSGGLAKFSLSDFLLSWQKRS